MPVRFRINEEELRRKLDKLASIFAFKIQREIVLRVPTRFRNKIVITKPDADWFIGTNDEIFKFWELGTKPHDIKAKFAKALAFNWPTAPVLPNAIDKHVYKKVRHPGTKGKKILEEIYRDKSLLNRLFKESLNQVK